MNVYSLGVINNRKKGFNEGKMVASAALGNTELYEFLHDNPAIEFHPSDYVNDPFIISRHNRMVSMNVAHSVDLTGQVSAEAWPRPFLQASAAFVRLCSRCAPLPGGKSILMLPPPVTTANKSRIVPMMCNEAVVVPAAMCTMWPPNTAWSISSARACRNGSSP
jgi:acyl-CoA hydrolase